MPSNIVPRVTDPPFEWGETGVTFTSGTSITHDLVKTKFDSTMATAEMMITALMGSTGNSGYLGALQSSIESANVPSIADYAVAIPTISIPTESRPAPTLGNLDLDFPAFAKEAPIFATLPTVDVTGLTPGIRPESPSTAISWSEIVHDDALFDEVVAVLVGMLQDSATGLSPVVEAEIIARAQARQDLIDDKQEQETLEFFSSRGFDLPTGAMAAAVAELASERARNRTDLNGKILIEQAELEQKNRQYALQLAKDLEAILRDHNIKRNDTHLDYAKAVAVNVVAVFSENVKAYLAEEQAKLDNIKTQVEYLRGVIESNRGLVDLFSAEAQVYSTTIDGKAKRNESVTEIYKAENIGYEAESRAITSAGQLTVEEYRLKVQSADLQLRKAIAEVEAVVSTYGTEQSLRERVAEGMANISMQLAASAYGAVNASAGISYNSSKSESESKSHSESRGVSYGHSQSLSESHSFQEEGA